MHTFMVLHICHDSSKRHARSLDVCLDEIAEQNEVDLSFSSDSNVFEPVQTTYQDYFVSKPHTKIILSRNHIPRLF